MACWQISLKAGSAACNLFGSQTPNEAAIKDGRTTFAFTPQFGTKLRALRDL
jgi:hypothetical protein